jgi:hypothetical protein
MPRFIIEPDTHKLMSGLIAGAAAAIIFGVVVGLFTLFFGFIPGAIVGYIVGFRWGYKRVVVVDTASTPMAISTTFGDTAFLALGFFGTIWLAVALPNLLFGYSGPYRGHWLGSILILLGLTLSPLAAVCTEKQTRKHLKSPLREGLAVISLCLFLVLVSVWWNWAEARDQENALHALGFLPTSSVASQI